MKIKQNKVQTFLYAILLTFAIAMFLLFVLTDMRNMPHEESVLLDNAVIYWIFKALCLVGVVFCVLGEVYFWSQLFSKEPLVEICDEYFYDNSSAISLGKIAWSDMERAYIKSGFLNIELKNPEVYFAKKNFIQMRMIKGNLKLGYGHICISTQRFKKQGEEFLSEFSKRKFIE